MRRIEIVHFNGQIANASGDSRRELFDDRILATLAIAFDQVNLMLAELFEDTAQRNGVNFDGSLGQCCSCSDQAPSRTLGIGLKFESAIGISYGRLHYADV